MATPPATDAGGSNGTPARVEPSGGASTEGDARPTILSSQQGANASSRPVSAVARSLALRALTNALVRAAYRSSAEQHHAQEKAAAAARLRTATAAAAERSLPVAPPPATSTGELSAEGIRNAERFLKREGAITRPYGGAKARAFAPVAPQPAPPLGWMEMQRDERLEEATAQLSLQVARVRLREVERASTLGTLKLLTQSELWLVPAVAKPGPPTAIPERLISFARATTTLSHASCLHLLTASGESKVASGRWLCSFAAQAGDLEALRWMRGRGVAWDELTPAKAAEGGHLHVLKYVRGCGCPWDALTMAAAASGGWLDCLQYCREHGCEWDHRVVEWAISNQQLAVYKWAIGNHAPASEHARARGDSLVRAARIWDEDED